MRRFGIITASIAAAAVLSLGAIAFANGGWGHGGYMGGPGYGYHMSDTYDHPGAYGRHMMAGGYGYHMDGAGYQDHMGPGWDHHGDYYRNPSDDGVPRRSRPEAPRPNTGNTR